MDDTRRITKRAVMRLKHFDYTEGGPYFLTICLHHKTPALGRISDDGTAAFNPFGTMVANVWQAMPEFNPGLILDEYVVMPDHFHAIIGFVDPTIWRALWPATTGAVVDQDVSVEFNRLSVSDIVGRFKLQTLKHYRQGVRHLGWPPYQGQLWQRGYWDRVIRNERDLQSHREYIYNNPLKKHLDRTTQDLPWWRARGCPPIPAGPDSTDSGRAHWPSPTDILRILPGFGAVRYAQADGLDSAVIAEHKLPAIGRCYWHPPTPPPSPLP